MHNVQNAAPSLPGIAAFRLAFSSTLQDMCHLSQQTQTNRLSWPPFVDRCACLRGSGARVNLHLQMGQLVTEPAPFANRPPVISGVFSGNSSAVPTRDFTASSSRPLAGSG